MTVGRVVSLDYDRLFTHKIISSLYIMIIIFSILTILYIKIIGIMIIIIIIKKLCQREKQPCLGKDGGPEKDLFLFVGA